MDQNTEQLLTQLSEKLGVAASHLWEVMITQAHISAINFIVVLSLISIIWITTIFVYFKYYFKELSRDDQLEYYIPITLGSIVLIVAIIGNIPGIITRFTNPEYWALKEIAELIK